MGRPFYLPDSREVGSVLTTLGSDYPGNNAIVSAAITLLGPANSSDYYYITLGLDSGESGADHPMITIVFFQDSDTKYIYTNDLGQSFGLNGAYVYNEPMPEDPPYPTRQPMTSVSFIWNSNESTYMPSNYQSPWATNWNTPLWSGTNTEGYFLAINADMYVDDQTTDEAIDYFFNKDPDSPFQLDFGCGVNTSRALHQEPGENDSSDYYHSGRVRCTLSWTSPVDDRSYQLDVNQLAAFLHYEQDYSLVSEEDDDAIIVDYNTFERFFEKKSTESNHFIEAYRSLEGPHYVAGRGGQGYYPFSHYVNYRSFNTFTLGDLIRTYSGDSTFTENDVYTVLTMTFYNVDLNTTVDKEVDYSSLYNSGIDPRVDDGKGDGEGSSWDPIPGYKDDSADPSLNPDPVKEMPLSNPTLSPIGMFNRTFVMRGAAVKQLSNYLSTTDDSTYEAIIQGLKLFGANPMNALIDLRLYPFDVKSLPSVSSTQQDIILGRENTQVEGYLMNTSSTVILDLGAIYIKEKHHSFLDYEPYTKINLYIPYIGTIEILPSVFMNRTLTVKVIVDFVTGAATAVVYCNGIPMIYQNGIIGISIAMTGDNAAEYANGIVGNIVGAVGSAAGAVANFATGNVMGGVKETVNAVSSGFDALNSVNDVQFQQAGSNSPLCNTMTPQQCYITVARPKKIFDDRDAELSYGFVNGFATSEIKTISTIGTGIVYAKLSSLGSNTSGTEPSPTPQEVDMIKQALNNGFFVT